MIPRYGEVWSIMYEILTLLPVAGICVASSEVVTMIKHITSAFPWKGLIKLGLFMCNVVKSWTSDLGTLESGCSHGSFFFWGGPVFWGGGG